jgi:MFS family permease
LFAGNHVLDATVVNVAFPHIQAGLHFSATSLSWVMNGYTLTFGGLLLLGGRAGDILGRRRMFLAGIVIFTLASLAGGLATSAAVLLAARAVQGIGARSPRPPCSRSSSAGSPRAGSGSGPWPSTRPW